MPEFPEVATVCRQLDAKIHGRKITQIKILRSGRETPVGDPFTCALSGATVKRVARRAKLLIFELTDGRAMINRLKESMAQQGQACRKCKQPVKKIVLAQRGTHYCPACQK